MSIYTDDLRKINHPICELAADEIEGLEKSEEILSKQNFNLKKKVFDFVYCGNCQKIQPASFRENDENCSDICCDECHLIIATMYRGAL